MPRSDRRLVLAAIFGLIVTSAGLTAWLITPSTQSYGECEPAESGNGGGTQGKPYKANDRPRVAAVPGFIQRLTANDDPCHGEDNEKRDLAAQEAAAAWGFWVAAFSALQFVLSAFGLWALLLTIRQGREANAISRRIGEAQTRAYLTITEAFILIDKEGEPSLDIKVKNSGQSPAIDFRWSFGVTYRTMSPHFEHVVPVGELPHRALAQDIPAGDEPDFTIHKAGYSPSQEIVKTLPDIKGGFIFVQVLIGWHDVFGNFCEEIHQFDVLAQQNFIDENTPLFRANKAVIRKNQRSGDDPANHG